MADTVITAEDTAQQHLGAIANNLDDALQKPHVSSAQSVQAEFEKEPLSAEVKKQAEQFQHPVENPVDPDKLHHKLFWFFGPKVGDVGAIHVLKEKVKYVTGKGQKAS